MDNIYEHAIHAVEEGAKFQVNFQTRSLKLDGKFIIRQGEYDGKLGVAKCDAETFFEEVENLYLNYKYSVPSERSEGKSRQYFKALPERELTDEQMLYGERRDKAQIALELYVLCQIINGFSWDENVIHKWFWQSSKDKDLVILREWIEPINK